ncbi:MFS transporter [Streptomyces sp. NPDC004436]
MIQPTAPGRAGAGADETGVRPASARPALAALSLSVLLTALTTGIAPVALPALADSFSASFSSLQWIVLAPLLSLTALVVGAGRLGDLFGRRRLLLAGLSLFAAASVASAAAPTLWFLVAARCVQGVGAAFMAALTMAFVAGAVPRAGAGRAMGLLGTMSAVGTALGPVLGGALVAAADWRAVFLAPALPALVALLLSARHLPADRPVPGGGRGRFDTAGTLLLALALTAYALAMTLGRGGTPAVCATLLLTAALGAGLFVRAQARAAAPLVPGALLRTPGLRPGLVTSGLVSVVMMTTLVVGPFRLSQGLGLDAARTGLLLSVGPLVAALTGVPAGHLADRWGAPRATVLGLGVMAAGAVALSAAPTALGAAGYVLPLAVLTAGYGVFQTANNTAVMADVPPDRRGVVSGTLNLSRNLGLVTGASVMGAVFAHAAAAAAGTDVATASPGAVAAATRVTFAVAAALVLVALAVAARATARRGPAADGTAARPERAARRTGS